MRPRPRNLLTRPTSAPAARNEAGAPSQPGLTRTAGGKPHADAPQGHEHATGAQKRASGRRDDRNRQPRGSLTRRPAPRLGPLEYALLTLIVLGIGITMTMAILNPS